MWDLIVSVPDHCLSFYFGIYTFLIGQPEFLQLCIQLYLGDHSHVFQLLTIVVLSLFSSKNVILYSFGSYTYKHTVCLTFGIRDPMAKLCGNYSF